MSNCKWTAMFALEDLEIFDTFKEAARTLIGKIKEEMGDEGMSLMVLEQATGIISIDKVYIPFYEVRDICCEAGWLVDGHWVE